CPAPQPSTRWPVPPDGQRRRPLPPSRSPPPPRPPPARAPSTWRPPTRSGRLAGCRPPPRTAPAPAAVRTPRAPPERRAPRPAAAGTRRLPAPPSAAPGPSGLPHHPPELQRLGDLGLPDGLGAVEVGNGPGHP